MRFLLILPVLLSLLTPLVGAARAADEKSATTLESAAGEWHLKTLTVKDEAVAVTPEAKVTLSLDKAGKVSGKGPVNRYFGGVKQDAEGKLSWTPFGSTRMAGPEPLMKLEDTYFNAIAQTTKLDRQGKALKLSSADGKTQLEFASAEQ